MRILFFILILFSNIVLSQAELLNAEIPGEIEGKSVNEVTLLKYLDVEENDVLWSKIVYEEIDLNEKLNFPLLFPFEEAELIGRKSLFRIIREYIIKGVENDSIDLQIYKFDNFADKDKYKKADILNRFSYTKSSDAIIQQLMDEGISRDEATKQATQPVYVSSNEVGGYKIKGIWYFDKRNSELKYRLLGLMPLIADPDELAGKKDNSGKLNFESVWIWYPSIREELNKHFVFNDRNNESRITFDALLINRRFNSFIYKYDNVYGNRKIEDYIKQRPGESDESYRIRFILESERIKKEILDFENDMWGY